MCMFGLLTLVGDIPWCQGAEATWKAEERVGGEDEVPSTALGESESSLLWRGMSGQGVSAWAGLRGSPPKVLQRAPVSNLM